MRILFASTLSYPPQDSGGSKSSTNELCLKLRERNHEAALLCGIDNGDWFGLWTRLRRKFSRKYNYPVDHFLHYPAYRGWKIEEGIPEVIHRFKPDIGIADAGLTMSVARTLIKNSVPTVVFIRDVEFDRMGALPFTDPMLTYVSNSGFTASVLMKQFGISSTIIPPLVYPERYKVQTKRKHVLHINPHPDKGIDITLELARLRPDIPFVIIEAWNLSKKILEPYRSKANNLPNVTWKGRAHDMRKVYREARIVLAPSRWEEAWGRIATEAHISGIPLITSTRGGLPESVGPGGILVDPTSPIDNWIDALSRLWDNPQEYARISEAASSYAMREDIQPEYLLEKLYNVLEAHINTTKKQTLKY